MIAANVAWNATNRYSGIGVALLNVAPYANVPMPSFSVKMPDRNSRSKPPMNALPSVNARL